MAASPLKILLVGPSKARKSALASLLAGVADQLTSGPGPTVGCRILELERSGSSVELWDVSGDQAYEAVWPAAQQAADGVLIVFAADAAGHAKEAELWYEWFVSKVGMPPERCACFGISAGSSGTAPLPALGDVPVEPFGVDNVEAVRRAFDKLVQRVAAGKAGRAARK